MPTGTKTHHKTSERKSRNNRAPFTCNCCSEGPIFRNIIAEVVHYYTGFNVYAQSMHAITRLTHQRPMRDPSYIGMNTRQSVKTRPVAAVYTQPNGTSFFDARTTKSPLSKLRLWLSLFTSTLSLSTNQAYSTAKLAYSSELALTTGNKLARGKPIDVSDVFLLFKSS